MSEHNWVQDNLDAYVTGALSSQERNRLEKHVESCEECAHAKAEICEMEQLMDGIFTLVRPDAGLEDRAIHELRRARRPRPSWLRFVAAAAAVVFLGGIGAGVQLFVLEGSLPFAGMKPESGKDLAQRTYFGSLRFRQESEGRPEELTTNTYALKGHDGYFADPFLTGERQEAEKRQKEAIGDLIDVVKETRRPATEITKTETNVTVRATKAPAADYDKHVFFGRGYSSQTQQTKQQEGLFFFDAKENETRERDLGKLFKMKVELDSDDKLKASLEKMFDKSKEGGENKAPLLTSKPGDGLPTTPTVSGGGPKGIPPGSGQPPGDPKNPLVVPIAPGYYNPPGKTPSGNLPGLDTFVPTPPPPVTVTGDKGTKRDDANKAGGDKGEKPNDDQDKKPQGEKQPEKGPDPKVAPPENTGRKIIRTGEMEFETDSFDKAVDAINQLINKVQGGFIATVNSDKLPNGKMKGSVVVRMPPQHLDNFIFNLRRELTKSGELKNQRIGSLDVTKQYTDIESRLRAARAIEERLIHIIKTGKGEIKDLVAAERELGVWRTKIEEMEGEIRYYSNQVALSTLTIQLYEKEIQAPTAIVVTETVTMRLEVDDVAKAHQTAMKTVEELKGRITRSELKQHSAGQLLSILYAEIPPAKRDAFVDALKKLGLVAEHQENQRQHTEGGSGPAGTLKPKQSDVQFQITMNNTANVRPKFSADLKVATTDVPASYNKILDAINKAKGQVRDGKLNEQDKLNIHAYLDFNVPISEKVGIDKLLDSVGPILERINIQAPISELSTERKYGYTLTLRDFASIPPRQSRVEIHAVVDVAAAYAKLQDAIAKAKGQIGDATLNEQDKLNVTARLDFTVPTEEKTAIEKLLTDLGTLLSRNNVQTPAHQLATTKKFGFSLTLRDFASIPPSKAADLKVATNDVPGSYAKLLDAVAKAKGQLVDAKLNEQDKFNITGQVDFSVPADEKTTIDKLLLEIGTVLSRNNVQAPMNQLSTAKKFGYSVALRDFATILPSHAADIKIAASDVPANYAKLVDAVVKAKGQISVSKLDEQDKLNVSAVLNFTVPTTEKPGIDKLLADIGAILSRNNVQAPQNVLTTDTKFGYSIVLRDFANIPPRETFILQLAAIDVPAAFRELQDAVAAAKGLVTVGQLIEDSKVKIEARFEFDVPAAERQAVEKLFAKVGAVLSRTSHQVPVNELATDQKVGFKLTVRSTAAIPPRETVNVKMEVKDVDARVGELKELVAANKGRIIDSSVDRHENGQVLGILKIEAPFASQDAILKQIKTHGFVASQKAVRNPQVAENELTTSHIIVTLAGASPIVPSDEGLGNYVRTSLYMSFKVFSVCLMLIILGVSAVLPWALVIWLVYKAYTKIAGVKPMQPAPAGATLLPKQEPPKG